MKSVFCRIGSVLVNLTEGGMAVIAMAVIYAFIFEKGNPRDHDIGLGIIFLLVWLAVLIIPNLAFMFGAECRKKDIILFQLTPFIIGAVVYIVLPLDTILEMFERISG